MKTPDQIADEHSRKYMDHEYNTVREAILAAVLEARDVGQITGDSLDVDIHKWVNRIIEGSTGFKVWEDREAVIHHVSREYSIAGFVIRCLANTECEDSDKVLLAIMNKRAAK